MHFQQIRSATALIEFAGVRFLVDPMLAPMGTYKEVPFTSSTGRGVPDCELPCVIEELFKVDAVIVTHLHFDHFDKKAREVLPKELPLFAGNGSEAQSLREAGFKEVRVLEETGSDFKGVTLCKTHCAHGDQNLVTSAFYARTGVSAAACGVIFKAPEEPLFYLAGDTIYDAGVKECIERTAPAVVAVNAGGAEFPRGHLLIMNEYDVWALMQDFPDAEVIATHVEGVSHATVTRARLQDFAREHALSRLHIPGDGETLTFKR